jgi:hypothetical protein
LNATTGDFRSSFERAKRSAAPDQSPRSASVTPCSNSARAVAESCSLCALPKAG